MYRGHGLLQPWQLHHFHFAASVQLFGVNHRTLPRQRNRTTGVASTTPTRNNGQAQLNTALYQLRHFLFGIGREHHERQLHTPVGSVGHMADPA